MRVMHRLGALLIALTLALPQLHAQSTAADDSAHWRATKADLDSIARDRGAPAYSKRAQTRIRTRDSLRVFKPAPAVRVASIVIHGSGASLAAGSTMQLSTAVTSTTGATITPAITWAATPTNVASISSSGLLTGLAGGTVTVTARADTATATRTLTVTAAQPPPDTVVTKPDTTSPVTPPSGGNVTLAQLPQATVDYTAPTGYTTIDVPASAGALQTALNTSGCKVNLRLAPDFQYAPVNLPVKPCNELHHTIFTTLNGLAPVPRGTRMTPWASIARRQARITTTGLNQPALLASNGVRGYYFEDIAITASGTTPLNAIVYLGNAATTLAQVPGDFVFSHVLVTGTSTLDLKRCYYLNSSRTAIVDSWAAECHSNNGDSQCVLGLNGPGPYMLINSYCEAGHEVIMFGGGDPSITQLVPSDITIRGSHITRPASWKGKWQVKNLIETKNARRVLVEGNVIENVWADGQVGYALLFKSVNQDGTAPWSVSQDITVRNNVIRNMGAGVNLCAACQGVVVPASRITIYNNVFANVNTGQYLGEAREWQFLQALTDVAITHNTTVNAAGVETAISFDGQPPRITRIMFASNIYDRGQYDIHGSGGSTLGAWIDTASMTWSFNRKTSDTGQCGGASDCTTSAQLGLSPTGVLAATSPYRLPSHDGAPLGADAAAIYAATAGVVITPPAGARPRSVAARTGYRSSGCLDVKVTDPAYAQKCAAAIRETKGGGSSVR